MLSSTVTIESEATLVTHPGHVVDQIIRFVEYGRHFEHILESRRLIHLYAIKLTRWQLLLNWNAKSTPEGRK